MKENFLYFTPMPLYFDIYNNKSYNIPMLNNRDKTEITISARRFGRNLFLCLVGAELLIVAADIFLHQLKWLPWGSLRIPFNITREDTVVNWFSSTQTFVVALILLAIFLLARQAKKKRAWGWAVLAGFFMMMSLDDGSKFHERMGSAFKDASSGLDLTTRLANAFPSYYWQVVLGPFLVGITVFMAIFLWREIKIRSHYYWMVVAVCLLAIAVMLDFAEGMGEGIFSIHLVTHNAKLIEEFLEMLGNSVFLVIFLQILAGRNEKILLRFKK